MDTMRMKDEMIQMQTSSRSPDFSYLFETKSNYKVKEGVKKRKTVHFHPSALKSGIQLTVPEQSYSMSPTPSELQPGEFGELLMAISIPAPPFYEGERLKYIKKCAQSIQSAHAERLLLLKRLKDTEDPPSVYELEYLRELYEEDLKLQQELSDALEAGRLNLQRQRAQEVQSLEDYYYERYGFVFIQPEMLDSWSLPPPLRSSDGNKTGQAWNVGVANHDHEEMERELEKLKKRLDNLGKSPTIQKQRKDAASKSSDQKCSIL